MSWIARASMSWLVSVTLRKRSDCTPTTPTSQTPEPCARTVSTRIGSLKRVPVRMWPGCMVCSHISHLQSLGNGKLTVYDLSHELMLQQSDSPYQQGHGVL